MGVYGNINTSDLKRHIIKVCQRVETLVKQDGVYGNIDVKFEVASIGCSDGQYCFSDETGYYYRCLERGTILVDRKTNNLFEITYWAVVPWIAEMSYAYEKKHRVNGQDNRKLMFSKRLQYFKELGEDYRQRAEFEINEILKDHPFQDELFK